jgi:hypothetical protein
MLLSAPPSSQVGLVDMLLSAPPSSQVGLVDMLLSASPPMTRSAAAAIKALLNPSRGQGPAPDDTAAAAAATAATPLSLDADEKEALLSQMGRAFTPGATTALMDLLALGERGRVCVRVGCKQGSPSTFVSIDRSSVWTYGWLSGGRMDG